MARTAIIKQATNIVENIVEHDASLWIPPSGYIAVVSDSAKIGDTYNPGTGIFVSPSQASMDAAILTSLRNTALSLEIDVDPIPKLFRALALVTLDEINSIRAAASVALPARTITQLRNAIRNKISTGAADS